jgi:hypothetical protein
MLVLCINSAVAQGGLRGQVLAKSIDVYIWVVVFYKN